MVSVLSPVSGQPLEITGIGGAEGTPDGSDLSVMEASATRALAEQQSPMSGGGQRLERCRTTVSDVAASAATTSASHSRLATSGSGVRDALLTVLLNRPLQRARDGRHSGRGGTMEPGGGADELTVLQRTPDRLQTVLRLGLATALLGRSPQAREHALSMDGSFEFGEDAEHREHHPT